MYPLYNQQFQPNYPQTPTSGITWVQGEAGAKSYLVAPNCTVQLWDSERPTIYLKSADGSGMPSMRVLDYTERSANTAQIEAKTDDRYKSLETELNGLKKEICALKSRIDNRPKKGGNL